MLIFEKIARKVGTSGWVWGKAGPKSQIDHGTNPVVYFYE